jgi:hypothetical protein
VARFIFTIFSIVRSFDRRIAARITRSLSSTRRQVKHVLLTVVSYLIQLSVSLTHSLRLSTVDESTVVSHADFP